MAASKWLRVHNGTGEPDVHRFEVPGGWLYETGDESGGWSPPVFVPEPIPTLANRMLLDAARYVVEANPGRDENGLDRLREIVRQFDGKE